MATLDELYSTLRLAAGDQMRKGRTPGNWDTDTIARIQGALDDSLRMVIEAYEWSFMKPVTTMVLWPSVTGTVSGTPSKDNGTTTITATAAKFYASMVGRTFKFDTSETEYTIVSYTSTTVIAVTGDASGETADDTFSIACTGDYLMPATFGGMCGPELDIVSDTTTYCQIQATGEGQIRREKAQATSWTGIPRLWATRWRVHTDTAAQLQELAVFPIPDASYTIQYQYDWYATQLASDNYPPGAQKYGGLFKQAVRWVIDRDYNAGGDGTTQMAYQEALAAAIRRENSSRRGTIGGTLGGADSDRIRWERVTTATVEGVQR